MRIGTVVIGNIGLTGLQGCGVSGQLVSATKNSGYTERDAFVDIVYVNKGYIPRLFVSPVLNSIFTSTTNDIF